eukprot:551619-Hanusia_phi.AAC.1
MRILRWTSLQEQMCTSPSEGADGSQQDQRLGVLVTRSRQDDKEEMDWTIFPSSSSCGVPCARGATRLSLPILYSERLRDCDQKLHKNFGKLEEEVQSIDVDLIGKTVLTLSAH